MLVECPTCHLRFDASGRAVGSHFRCRCGATLTVAQPTPDAATLDCPRCGAPASPDSATCAYCQASLAVVGCPRCLGRVFQGARFCQHCGAPLDVAARDAASASAPLQCPRCPEGSGNALAPHRLGTTSLEECPQCGGTWLDAQTFASVVSERDRQAALASALPGVAAAPRAPREASVRYLKCPDCARLMNRENFGRRSGVVIDVCRTHGVWFDAGELGDVVGFVMRGGLDETRRRELEEAKEEVRRKRIDLLEQPGQVNSLGLGATEEPSLLDLVFRLWR
jgi:Zn-finger nucleic acid-binding protein